MKDRARLTAAYERAELGRRLGMGSRPAILVVDFQRGFVDPEVPGGADFSPAIAETRRLLDAARTAGVPILFTRVAYQPAHSPEARVFIEKIPSLRFARAGSANVELDPRLGRKRGERLVTKQFASSFHGTRLRGMLKAEGVDTLVVCGCTTSGCIRATVVDALQHGFRPLVPEECVADIDPEPHRANLFDIDAKYGDVVSTEEVIGLIEGRVVTDPKRVGLLVPSSNTVMEPDLQRALAHVATVHTARMLLTEPVTPESEEDLLDRHAPAAARGIATLEPDVVVFGCASAGTIRGRAADERLRHDLSEIAGAPVIGVFDVIATALRTRGARRIALLTPYPEDMTAEVVAGLREQGLDVAGDRSLGVVSNLAVGRIEPKAIASEAFALLEAIAPVDALVISCTNLRALEARSEIAAGSGVEVVTANSAAVEHTLAQILE